MPREKGSPEHLLPTHIGGEFGAIAEEEHQEEAPPSLKEVRESRLEALREAPSLESKLEAYLKEKGIERPENLNLSLVAIEEFQRYAHEAQDLRRVTKEAKDPKERMKALRAYGDKKKKIDEYLAYGPSFEAAYREYIRSRNSYVDFSSSLQELTRLESVLGEPSFQSLPEESEFDDRSRARLEMIMREATSKVSSEEELEALKTIYAPGSKEYKKARQLLTTPEGANVTAHTKAELESNITTLRAKVTELWEDPMVRYFWQQHELEELLKDFAAGEDVLETPTVVRHLNELHEWETQHQRTTIGGVLVGPPGVGKTTLAHHYLQEKGRKYAYIDLSEDVTRFLLYGSKSLEFKDPLEYYEALAKRLGSLDEESLKKWIAENSKSLMSTFGVKEDQVAVTLIAQIKEALDTTDKDIPPELAAKMTAVRGKVVGLAEHVFRKELASEFGHLVQHNGWRDGMVITALRNGDSVIMDEFNKNKNWSLIYGLMTAKPGEKWYFADNQEYIQIPENWRMYFTANIGRKHGGFAVAEALASRAGGKVMEVDYPTPREEMQVALASLANAEGDFLRRKEDLAKLYVLINEGFPNIRKLIQDKPQSIPLSYRTLRDLGEKLVLYRDPKSKQPVYQPTKKTFDEALYDELVESYAVYEDKKTPQEIVNGLTTIGLLLDDKVKSKVVEWIGEATYNERRGIFDKHQEDFNAIVKKIRGLSRDVTELPTPERRQF